VVAQSIKKTILLIDDDEAIRELFLISFKNDSNILPHVVGSAVEAIDYVKKLSIEQTPVIIICDAELPGLSGVVLAEVLGLLLKNVPHCIIGFSGHSKHGAVAQRFLKLGYPYIEKGQDLEAFKKAIFENTKELKITKKNNKKTNANKHSLHKKIEKDILETKEKIKGLNLAKTEFLANVCHEIRTPLAVILGFSDLLIRSKTLSDLDKKYIDRISANGKLLSRLINDLLDMNKIELNNIEIEKVPFTIKQLIKEICAQHLEDSQSKNISLTYDIDPSVINKIENDPVRIKQILKNLISNALKFTEKGSIRIHVLNGKSNNEIWIDIIDSGIGIAEGFKERLFEPFEQGDLSVAKKFAGAGLGLGISYKLALLLGGKLELIFSEANKGSHFRLTLYKEVGNQEEFLKYPVFAKDHSKQATEGDLSWMLSGKRVLYVEDNPDNQVLMIEHLKNFGAKVIDVADDGFIALEKAKMNNFDLILMDLQLPGMDGVETAFKLKALGVKAPIVAVTAHAAKYANHKILEKQKALFSKFLMKPILDSELALAIEGL